MFHGASEPRPKRQCIVASLSQNALWQCAGACCLDLGLDLLEERLGLPQPQKLTVLLAYSLFSGLGIDLKELIELRYNTRQPVRSLERQASKRCLNYRLRRSGFA